MYERAAAKGNPQSLNNLGYAYRHGEGVTKDLDRALSYLEQAHALGLLDATINVGDIETIGDRLATFKTRRIDPEATFGC